jgi:hypothetical protein
MFEITFEDEIHRRWSSEFIFRSLDEAKNYLLSKGFIERNRLFYREKYNWSIYLKAYIMSKKIYDEGGNLT